MKFFGTFELTFGWLDATWEKGSLTTPFESSHYIVVVIYVLDNGMLVILQALHSLKKYLFYLIKWVIIRKGNPSLFSFIGQRTSSNGRELFEDGLWTTILCRQQNQSGNQKGSGMGFNVSLWK